MTRRGFLASVGAAAIAPAFASGGESPCPRRSEERQSVLISNWDEAAEKVTSQTYSQYMSDGDTRGFKALEALEFAFDKVLREAKETVVRGDAPAVWSVYNMGYVVKTRETLFSIDLVHRLAADKFAPLLDFALITHNHGDHWRQDFYDAMNRAHKTVVTNFLDNYGATHWGGASDDVGCGYTRARKTFRIKDVEITTSLIDHNRSLIDFVTAFEIRCGDFVLYHTGDSGSGTVPKLGTGRGSPDLWLFFPGCGIETKDAVRKVNAKRVVFGHMWELGHRKGRFTEHMIRARLADAKAAGCEDVSVAFWGDRII